MSKTAKRTGKLVRTRSAAEQRTPNAYLLISPEEQEQLHNDFVALRSDRIQEFLEAHGIPKIGPKGELLKRVVSALEDGRVSLDEFVEFLDGQAIWGKQHVFLYGPPTGRGSPPMEPSQWGKPEWLRGHLAEHRVLQRLNQRRPLVLPPKLELMTIEASPAALRAVAVQKREGWERVEELDEERVSETEGQIELRAFKRVVTRGLVCFEWDLANNLGMMQITQLPTHHRYDQVAAEFAKLVEKWLPIDRFPPLMLGAAITALYSETTNPKSRVRAHGVEIEGLDGRKLQGKSKKAKQPLKGNPVIDTALDSMSQANGLGSNGNFFFADPAGSRTTEEAHVIVWAGDAQRINFTTPQDETTIRNVLQRIRAAC